MNDIDTAAEKILDKLAARNLRRFLTPGRIDPDGAVHRGGRRLIDFSSNDYLGLSHHPALIARAAEWTEKWGVGATASRLVTGTLELHRAIEEKIAAAKGSQAALLLNSGYQANMSLIPALNDAELLGGPADIFADRLIHASIHAGIRASGLRQTRFRHNDLHHLDMLLTNRENKRSRPIIITESVFSMDGDRADLAGLADIAERHGALLYVDDAHATGVLGPNGMGLTGELPGRIPLVMGTFGKAMGSFGAYIACSKPLRDYLVNRCAGFIYTTALPPPVLGAIDAALDLIPQLDAERQRLQANADRLRSALTTARIDTCGSSTQIVPAILGSSAAAQKAAARIEDAGLLVTAIRPPTVPTGTARLRFALSSRHGRAEMDQLIDQIQYLS